MSIYFLLVPQISGAGLIARLGQLMELHPIEISEANQAVATGDVCFASGESIAALPEDEQSQLPTAILQHGAHLIIIAPLSRNPLPRLIGEVESPELQESPFGPVRITEQELQQTCGLDQLAILFNQTIRLSTGKPVAVTSDGKSVITRYQHRSTWGQLLYITLLLGSTSTRSRRSHRVALVQGLVGWLAQISSKATAPVAAGPSVAPDLTHELPIVLMAVHLAQQDEMLAEDQLKPAVDRIRAKLPRRGDVFHLNESLAQLEAIGILSSQSKGQWKVNTQQMTAEIDRWHLASYLRRLR